MNEEKVQKPKSSNQRDLDSAKEQFDKYEQNIKDLTLDRMNEAPVLEMEQQTKLSSREIDKSKDVYIKPVRSIGAREKFNERFRDEWNFQREDVQIIAENKEIIGEMIETWTKPFPGVQCEFWQIPVNKPVYVPRHVAERIKASSYHRMHMENRAISQDGMGSYYGTMVVDNTIQRLDAIPVAKRKSIFMGASGF